MAAKSDVLQGTLDLMVLKTLDVMGPLHGYGLARRIEQVSDQALAAQPGDALPGARAARAARLDRLRAGACPTAAGARASTASRRAGRRQLQAETESWRKTSRIMARFLEAEER